VVSAWSHANGLSFGQIKVNDKTNEITAIPELIKQLTLEGVIVTIDAMGCQREIASALVEKKADYVFVVKGNQGNLHESIRDCFKLQYDDFVRYTAKDEIAFEHGPIERRQVEILEANILKGLVDLSQWAGIHSIIKMTYINETKADEVSTENRYYISSVGAAEPEKILRAIRVHWGIESMHWSLDVTFKEDSCRVRDHNSALNLNCLRKMALSFLKAETTFKASIRRKQIKLWSTPNYALKVFAKI
jgi:predicted transposase YbfD/YdcC